MAKNNNTGSMLKQQSVIDLGSECPIITYEIAKKLDLEINKSLPNTTDEVIVKPEIQDIINLITNPDITKNNGVR
ncbi:hypothetical protein Glove_216g164 [Diversispora epigaea]|uniref:Uncharacterized protein n=1 Tax=Diversispora epigaea TaxID=1348612 RepID=A0A397IHI2_9GLOM|nr:hypothetical protein Glove_216g164 [Diversispora epigaea]